MNGHASMKGYSYRKNLFPVSMVASFKRKNLLLLEQIEILLFPFP